MFQQKHNYVLAPYLLKKSQFPSQTIPPLKQETQDPKERMHDLERLFGFGYSSFNLKNKNWEIFGTNYKFLGLG